MHSTHNTLIFVAFDEFLTFIYRFAGGALLAVDAVDIHEAGGLLEAAVGRQHHLVALNLGHLDVSLPNGINIQELKIKTM